MRLINCWTRQLEEHFGGQIPPYAILSHTWGPEEVTFAEFTGDQATARQKAGYQKIDLTCRQALKDDLKYAWVDTCCIDKTSSAELSEAINSMFAWYASSRLCYVYLSDVLEATFLTTFPTSRWFTRGWTLQELLAPWNMMFYDRHWNYLGTRGGLADEIVEITSIPNNALRKGAARKYYRDQGLGQYSVAKRMSWAARRTTTRIEDSAYSLLGIFDINMPLLYGEGSRAFDRLQKEIMKKTNDHSIFAWGLVPNSEDYLQPAPEVGAIRTQHSLISSHLLAKSPADFENCGNVEKAGVSTIAFTATNAGLEIELPLIPLLMTTSPFHPDTLLGSIAVLNCSPSGSSELIGIFLRSTSGTDRSVGEVHRAQLAFPTPLYTVPIGLGLAVQSKTTKFTIVDGRDEELQPIGVFTKHRGFRVAITETQCFQAIEYYIADARTLGTTPRDQVIWDSKTKVLTAHTSDRHDPAVPNDFCCFHFKQPRENGKRDFTLLLRTSPARVALFKGLVLSDLGRDRIFDSLGIEGKHVGEQCFAINTTSDDEYEVVASITHNVVFGAHIYQVCVDAVPLYKRALGRESLEATEMLIPPRPPHRPSNRALRDGIS